MRLAGGGGGGSEDRGKGGGGVWRLFVLLPALQLRIARYIVEEFEVYVLLEMIFFYSTGVPRPPPFAHNHYL